MGDHGPRVRNLPYQPLLEYITAAYGHNAGDLVEDEDRPGVWVPSNKRIAFLLGVERNTVSTWKERGIELFRADTIAEKRLGIHPSLIWGSDYNFEIDPLLCFTPLERQNLSARARRRGMRPADYALQMLAETG